MGLRVERGGLPDLPPEAFRGLPPPPGVKVIYFDRQPELQAWAVANHISPGSAFGQRRFWGGYAPAIKTVGLIRPGVMKDDEFDRRAFAHEALGHGYDLVHRPGTDADWGYLGPDGRWWPAQTPDELSAAKSRYAQAAFNWNNVFAKPAQTGAARNLFKGS